MGGCQSGLLFPFQFQTTVCAVGRVGLSNPFGQPQLGLRNDMLRGSILNDPALLLDPRRMVLSDFGFVCPWVRALARLRVPSRDVARAETTPLFAFSGELM